MRQRKAKMIQLEKYRIIAVQDNNDVFIIDEKYNDSLGIESWRQVYNKNVLGLLSSSAANQILKELCQKLFEMQDESEGLKILETLYHD